MNICECLAVNANLFPDQTAVVFRGKEISYRELNDLSLAAAEFLSDKGIAPGDRVSIQIGNCPAFPVWYYATLRLGAIAVSISTRLSLSEREYIIDHSGAKLLVTDGEPDDEQNKGSSESTIFVSADGRSVNQSDLEIATRPNEWHEAAPSDAALILYTSGTTGFPKGATLSHLNVRSNVAAFNHLCRMTTSDRVLLAVPLFHCFGQNALLNSVLNVGGTLILQERFDLTESRELIQSHQVTQLYGVPMMFQLLLESCQRPELASVNYCFSAAAPLAIQTSLQWEKKFGLPIHEGYGLTETSPFASYNHRNKFVAGSIGTPIDAVEMKVVDSDTGKPCETDQLGEIAIRGPNVMLGYWNQPEETDQSIRDGWFYSGDIGKQDADGYFYIVDRVKDMIAVGGMKVFPAEVERVLRDQDSVLDAAVVGIEEAVLGEQVIGFVVLESGAAESPEEILGQVKQDLASYKLPRRIYLMDELPRNPSGKILKTKLRELARQKSGEVTAGKDDQEVRQSNQDSTNSGESPTSDPPDGMVSGDPVHRILEPGLLDRLQKVHPAEMKETIANSLAELVIHLTGNEDPPDHDQTFLDLGMDSLMLVELGTQLQLELQSSEPMPPTLIFDYPRINDLAEYLFDSLREEGSDKQSGEQAAEKSLASKSKTNGELTTAESKMVNQANQVSNRASNQELVQEIQGLSEEEALEQLMKELE